MKKMNKIIALLKRSFDLLVKNHWLKVIDKECDKYIKLHHKLREQKYIVYGLADRYKEIYGVDLLNPEGIVGEENESQNT